MKSVKACISLSINVCSLLVKIPYSLKISHISCVKIRSKTLLVLFVEPLNYLLAVVFLVNLIQAFPYLGLPPVKFYCMVNIELDDIEVTFICKLMEDVVLGIVNDEAGIKVLILCKELIDLCQFTAFKKYDFKFLILLFCNHLIFSLRLDLNKVTIFLFEEGGEILN
jgi:hypothetical protein